MFLYELFTLAKATSISVLSFHRGSQKCPRRYWSWVYRYCPGLLTRNFRVLSIPAAFFLLYQDVTHPFPFFAPSLSFSDAPQKSMVTISMNSSISDSAMHSSSLEMKRYVSSQNWQEEKDLCSVEHLLAGGKQRAFSVPKATRGWTFDFNPCQDWRTWNFFVFPPCKTIPLYCDVCVKVATKAQPSVMAHIIPDLAWHH